MVARVTRARRRQLTVFAENYLAGTKERTLVNLMVGLSAQLREGIGRLD